MSGIAPTSVEAGSGALTLTVSGSGFVQGSTVHWNGSSRTTTFGSATQLTASIAAGDVASAGSAQVTVVTPAPGGGTSQGMTFTIAPEVVATVDVEPDAGSLFIGETLDLSATPRSASGAALTDRTVTWESDDPDVADVDDAGVVTAIAPGTVTITATSEGVSGEASIEVSAVPAASVEVEPESGSLIVGETLQLSATVLDADGNALEDREITWASDDPDVAEVDENGLVTAIAAGTATITATSGTASGTANVTVASPAPIPASVEITPTTVALNSAGGTAELTAVVRDAGGAAIPGASVTWSSSSEGVATVSPATGSVVTVTAVTSGTSNVTATSGDAQASVPVAVDLPPAPFITTWQVEPDYLEIIVPTTGGGYNYNLYWENTVNPAQNGMLSNVTGNAVFTVPAAGTYRVEISGAFPRIFFVPASFGVLLPHHTQIRTVEQWGDIEWGSMERAFQSTQNLTVTATDAPNLTGVTSLRGMFQASVSMNGEIGHWNTDGITDMRAMFRDAASFNQPLNHDAGSGTWNTGNVTDMEDMFQDAIAFNQNLDQWDVSQVTTMREMFRDATAFNGDLSAWNPVNVTTMNQMFDGASAFNQDIGDWDVSSVTQFGDMFENAISFNQDIGGWDTSAGAHFTNMFRGASSFDQDLGGLDLSSAVGVNFSGWLDGTVMSVANYDASLIGWSASADANNAPKNVIMNHPNLTFCDGAAARQSLIVDHGWTITDGGLDPGCISADGLWVVMADGTGGGATIATAPDGVAWIGRANPFNIDSKGVAWNGSLWVAMGRENSMIATSPDGVAWTPRASPFTTEGIGVAWGNGLWVAGGRGNATIATSTNGITWTARSTPVDNRVRGVAWNGSLWVAVGRGSQTIATSPNGITWTGRASPMTDAHDVAWNGDLWVVAGEGGATIATSPDGITWTPRANPLTTRARGVAWNGTIWMAGGVGSSTTATSPDGINWTGITTPLYETVRGVAWGGGQWVLAGEGGGHYLATSTDGATWATPTTPFTAPAWHAAYGGIPGVPSGGF